MSWTDSLIGFFSPRRGFERQRYRYLSHAFSQFNKNQTRKFEGAGRGRRLKDWRATNASANAENFSDSETLRARARDLVRNNPDATSVMQVCESNIIGTGIRPAITVGSPEVQADLRAAWKDWAGTMQCDWDGVNTFYGLQRLIVRSTVQDGEVFIRRRIQAQADPRVNPVKLQLLEADHLATHITKTIVDGGNRVVRGIEFNEDGQRVAYHMYVNHPGASGLEVTKNFIRTVRIPADEIIHFYRVDRPGQATGVSWLAPVIVKMKDFDDFNDAQLLRQKIAACYAVFIESPDGEDVNTLVPQTTGEENQDDNDIAIPGDEVSPGMITALGPGKKVVFGDPPGVSDSYADFSSANLRRTSKGVGLSYESVSGDLSRVNFSSARLGWIEMGRNTDGWRILLMNPRFNVPAFQWFLLGAELTGRRIEGATVEWTPPRREMIDPTKEVPAKNKAIRSGLTTLSEAIRETGRDPETHFAELAEDKKRVDELGLTLDSDASKTNQSGAAQQQQQRPARAANGGE